MLLLFLSVFLGLGSSRTDFLFFFYVCVHFHVCLPAWQIHVSTNGELCGENARGLFGRFSRDQDVVFWGCRHIWSVAKLSLPVLVRTDIREFLRHLTQNFYASRPLDDHVVEWLSGLFRQALPLCPWKEAPFISISFFWFLELAYHRQEASIAHGLSMRYIWYTFLLGDR